MKYTYIATYLGFTGLKKKGIFTQTENQKYYLWKVDREALHLNRKCRAQDLGSSQRIRIRIQVLCYSEGFQKSSIVLTNRH